MKKIRSLAAIVITVLMLVPMFSFNMGALDKPELTVENFRFTLTMAEDIKDMRYAPGVHTTTAEIRAAEGNVALSNSIVVKNTVDGIFSYEMPKAGVYSLWVRMKDGTSYILPLDITDITPYVSTNGVRITVHNLHDVKDLYLAKGEYYSYREIKDHGYIVSISAAKIGTKHDYTYTVYEPGVHTVLVRHNDGTQDLFHPTLTVDEPVFTKNGLQVIISNIPDVKVIRTAYGTWNTTGELKATDTIRNFSAKTAIKGKDPYTIQYREEGAVTVIVEYNNGYVKVFHYDVAHREPALTQRENTVSFGDLEGLQVIRYAPGVYGNVSDIKKAEGSEYIRPAAAVDGVITVTLQPGTYSFCVQYNDESYNYYVITIDCTDHEWGEWVVTTEPTYKTEGEECRECTLCGETQTREVPKLICTAHRWGEWVVTTEPTYKTEGEEVRECSLCGKTETQTVPMLVCTHRWGEWTVVTAATEEAEGLEERTCGVCGEKEERAIPKLEPVPIPTATGIKVSSAFTDDMILQRDESLSVWGTATSDSGSVVVELNGKYAWTEVDANGRWKATFADTFEYSSEPTTLTVMGGEEEYSFSNLLIGDVYFMIGQSNVFYSLNMLKNEMAERGEGDLNVDYDDGRNMRFFRISSMDYKEIGGIGAQGTDTVYIDVYNDRPWLTSSDIAVDIANNEDNTFSALGYLFAYQMTEKTDIPVGVIEIDASGSPLISFAPNHLAEKWGHEAYDYSNGTYHHKVDEVEDDAVKTRFVYNQAIYPVSQFSTAGLIWYQGESDWYNVRERLGIDSDNYFVPQFAELMEYYRATFGNDDFPIYMVELPPCYKGSTEAPNAFIDYGETRAEMGNLPNYVDDLYIMSSSDMWFDGNWQNNVHPPIKLNQSIRLSALVCARMGFGNGSLEDVQGPTIRSVEYTQTGATLTFNSVGRSIGVAHPEQLGREIRGIQARVMYNGYPKWIDVTNAAFVDERTITFDIGQEIYGVRYNAVTDRNSPYGVNLCNSYGMPAIAFSDYCDKQIPAPDPYSVVPTATAVRVSNAFSDNMILQRDESLSVWGFGEEGGVVVVNLGGKKACAQVGRDGTWKATFAETFPYNYYKQPLVIQSGGADIVIKDVLIGDVYFLIGQSNVNYSLAEQKLDLALKNMSNQMNVDYNDARSIRFFRMSSTDFSDWTGPVAPGTKTKFNDVYNNEKWMMPSKIGAQVAEYTKELPYNENYNRYEISKNVYSALGYQFAFNMCARSVIPVGVIEIDASACPLTSFAPNELANKWGHEALGADGTYHYKLNETVEQPNAKSRFVYNQMIYPLSGFSTAGIIWYQGESDLYNNREYFGYDYTNTFPKQFAELMTYFRATFGNSDFPVYMIELPSCFRNNDYNAFMDFGNIRAEMGTISQYLPEFYMVSSSDLWYDTTWWNNLHPYIKYAQAARLSEAVYQYHNMKTNLELVLGPQLNHVDYVSESKAIVTFDHVGFGLNTAYGGNGYVKGIEVLINVNGNLIWHPHEGNIITGHNCITVDTGSFELYGVRYNAHTEARFPQHLTLCNSYNMPAVAFVDYRYQ